MEKKNNQIAINLWTLLYTYFLSLDLNEKKNGEKKKSMNVVIVSFTRFYRLLSLTNGPYFHDHLSFIRSIQPNIILKKKEI